MRAITWKSKVTYFGKGEETLPMVSPKIQLTQKLFVDPLANSTTKGPYVWHMMSVGFALIWHSFLISFDLILRDLVRLMSFIS